MVYGGKPSRGCQVCRKRRIKCDEAEPSCSYCVKRGLTCPGYKSAFDVAWRDQNIVAERSVRRRKHASQKAEFARACRQELEKYTVPDITVVPTQDRQGYALNFFFSAYILIPRDWEIRRSFLDFLYPVWTNAAATSPLIPAVTSVASYLLEAWSNIKPGLPDALSCKSYDRAVVSLRKCLASGEAVGDDVLLAVLMLDFYENLLAFYRADKNRSPHSKGSAALVDRRRKVSLHSTTSQGVLLGARNHVVGRALSNREPVPINVSNWVGMAPDVQKTAALRLDDINLDLANFQASYSDFQASSNNHYDLHNALEQATRLDERYIEWQQGLPAHWTPVRVQGDDCIPPSILAVGGLYADYCDVHSSIFHAYTLNGQSYSRIELQVIILDLLSRLGVSELSAASAAAMAIIQEMADNMCASVPFHLGDKSCPLVFGDKTAKFPHALGVELPEDHHTQAAAFGGWFFATRCMDLLGPKVPLREGQKPWIGGQLGRTMMVYGLTDR